MFEFFAIALILALPYVAVLVVLTVLAPSWRWVVGLIVMSGVVLAAFWIWHWMIGQTVFGAGYLAGLMMGMVLTLAWIPSIGWNNKYSHSNRMNTFAVSTMSRPSPPAPPKMNLPACVVD